MYLSDCIELVRHPRLIEVIDLTRDGHFHRQVGTEIKNVEFHSQHSTD